jgi:hypothetical protein
MGAVKLALRLCFCRAWRLICSFICEYFLKTCPPLAEHLGYPFIGYAPALNGVAYLGKIVDPN